MSERKFRLATHSCQADSRSASCRRDRNDRKRVEENPLSLSCEKAEKMSNCFNAMSQTDFDDEDLLSEGQKQQQQDEVDDLDGTG